MNHFYDFFYSYYLMKYINDIWKKNTIPLGFKNTTFNIVEFDLIKSTEIFFVTGFLVTIFLI